MSEDFSVIKRKVGMSPKQVKSAEKDEEEKLLAVRHATDETH